jgi:hypothetical protein
MAEEAFSGDVDTAQVIKPGHQTIKNGMRGDFLRCPRLPNTLLLVAVSSLEATLFRLAVAHLSQPTEYDGYKCR